MSWGEAHRLTLILLKDPSSAVSASVRGWSHPLERVDMTMRDLYDLQHRSKAKRKPDAYPRPWDKPRSTNIGGGAGMSLGDYQQMREAIASQN